MSRILVTGGLGCLGAPLVRSLLDDGNTVRVLDNASRGRLQRIAGMENQIEIIEGDIRNPAVVKNAVRGIDCVCHLAYVNGTEYFYKYPTYILDVAIKGMINILNACIAEGVSEFLLFSSSEVYNNAETIPTDESATLIIPNIHNPRFSYGGGKIACELMAIHYGASHFERMLIVRPHNVYGPDMGWEHVIPQTVHRMHTLSAADKSRPLPFLIQGDGTHTRAFVHIDDFTNGVMTVLKNGKDGAIYHIGTQNEVRIADVIRLIAMQLQCDIEIESSTAPSGAPARRCPDISAIQALGYIPTVSLEAGLKQTVPWYVENPPPETNMLKPEPIVFM